MNATPRQYREHIKLVFGECSKEYVELLTTENDAMREALEKSKRRIIQLSDTANYLSNRLGLGNKVHADDFYDVIDNALALANGSRER